MKSARYMPSGYDDIIMGPMMNSKAENIYLVLNSKYLPRFMSKWMNEQKGDCVLFPYNKIKIIQITKNRSVSIFCMGFCFTEFMSTILTGYKKNNKIDINTKCASLFFYKQTVTILCSLKGFQKRITKWNIRLNDFKYLATSYLSHSKNKPIEQQKHTCQTNNRETMFIWIICSLPTNFSKI